MHEEHGTTAFARIFGSLLSFGSLGLLIFDEYLFPTILSMTPDQEHEYLFSAILSPKPDQKQQEDSKQKLLFQITLGATCASTLFAWIGYVCAKRNEQAVIRVYSSADLDGV